MTYAETQAAIWQSCVDFERDHPPGSKLYYEGREVTIKASPCVLANTPKVWVEEFDSPVNIHDLNTSVDEA